MTAKKFDQDYRFDEFDPIPLSDPGPYAYSYQSNFSSFDDGVGLQREDLERLRLHPLDYLNMTYEEVRDQIAAWKQTVNQDEEHPRPTAIVEAPPRS